MSILEVAGNSLRCDKCSCIQVRGRESLVDEAVSIILDGLVEVLGVR